jgi:hypothetical protein
MPTVLDVERLRFTFRDDWLRVVKWDDSPTYRTGIEKVKGELDGQRESTKAMDLVGLHRTEGLFLIEAKDFRPTRGPGGARPNASPYGGRWQKLPLEIALKTRDTLAGLVGWGVLNTRVRDEILVGYVMEAPSLPIHVIACVLEERRSTEPEAKLSIRRKTLEKDIQTKLNWVDRKVRLIDPFRDPPPHLPGVTVVSLPASSTRAGP